MIDSQAIWQPRYILTPAIARGLMTIEAARAVVDRTPLSPFAEADLRRRARHPFDALSPPASRATG